MMKRFALLSAALLCSMLASAQDIISLRSGQTIEGKVTEIGVNTISYKKSSNLDGPTYTVAKIDVFMVKYENGEKDIFDGRDQVLIPNIRKGMKYSELKYLYGPRYYHRLPGDRYSPVWCAIGTAFIPGLGQMICGEGSRGVAMLTGNIALSALIVLSANEGISALAIGGFCCKLGLGVWTICDAVDVAIVKNLYERDLRTLSGVDFDIVPSVSAIPSMTGSVIAPGLTLALKF